VKQQNVVTNQITAVFRLEKNGRGGKTVTVIDGFPKNEVFLKDLTKLCKVQCGVGGSYQIGEKSGIIEIQGDKRDQVKKILESRGIKYKGH
jgi:translation initiation factor 1